MTTAAMMLLLLLLVFPLLEMMIVVTPLHTCSLIGQEATAGGVWVARDRGREEAWLRSRCTHEVAESRAAQEHQCMQSST